MAERATELYDQAHRRLSEEIPEFAIWAGNSMREPPPADWNASKPSCCAPPRAATRALIAPISPASTEPSWPVPCSAAMPAASSCPSSARRTSTRASGSSRPIPLPGRRPRSGGRTRRSDRTSTRSSPPT
ncbi:hypothetical protein ACIA5D_49715 [Actinoplanes sp. NPDC051513]|uniref:hypothetical protein n=1 Tax=Actinoplanes sp. NPDC051513 TaxID=3363908 RepID=UPI0037AF8C8E